jgi:hypothetical protein
MASDLQIFSIYKVQNEDKYYLLRTGRPGFSNTSQSQENLAISIEQNKRAYILRLIEKTHNNQINFDFIGEMQDFPIGDELYAHAGKTNLDIYFLNTEFGQPWIIIGTANSETEFLAKLNGDEDLLSLRPVGGSKKIKVTFITEDDFDLSGIENFAPAL